MKNSLLFFEKQHNEADDFMCNQCQEGHMKKLEHPESFDFNKDGYVPLVCDECGSCSDIERIIYDIGTMTTPLSNRFIKNILNQIVYTKRIDYKFFNSLLRFFKQKKIFSLYNLAYLIYESLTNHGYVVDMEFILKVIYQKYKPLHAYA